MKKVLIVEDDAVINRLYHYFFDNAGFQLQIATDGEAAIRLLETYTPDLVVVDLMLPKVHGIEVIKHLRSQPATALVPIVVFSNAYLHTMVKAAWQAGANMCLTKADCSPEQLLQIVRSTLEGGQLPTSPATAAAPPSESLPATPADGSANAESPAPTAAPAPASPRRVKLPPEFAPRPAAPPPTSVDDAQRRLLVSIPDFTTTIRACLPACDPRQAETQLLPQVRAFKELLGVLLTQPETPATSPGSRMLTVLGSFLDELIEEPSSITPSSLRTATAALDFLPNFFQHAARLCAEGAPPPLIMVVDDEVISRRTVCSALEMGAMRALSLEDPSMAMRLLQEGSFDLIFLDVDMPAMNGFELCSRLRSMPNQKDTPVVFVTGLSSFENRARSILSGGNDLIAKPFILPELALKALTYVLRRRVPPAG
jgi:CheY-like chemotaxis protein